MIDLAFRGSHLDDRIEKARRPNDLLDDDPAGVFQLIGTRCGGHIDDLFMQRSNSWNLSGRLSTAEGKRNP